MSTGWKHQLTHPSGGPAVQTDLPVVVADATKQLWWPVECLLDESYYGFMATLSIERERERKMYVYMYDHVLMLLCH